MHAFVRTMEYIPFHQVCCQRMYLDFPVKGSKAAIRGENPTIVAGFEDHTLTDELSVRQGITRSSSTDSTACSQRGGSRDRNDEII